MCHLLLCCIRINIVSLQGANKVTIIHTNKWLRDFIRKRKETPSKLYFELQREVICEPISACFEEYNSYQLHRYFLENGMFYPDTKIFSEVKMLEKKDVWGLVSKVYTSLKENWRGEEVTIFILPIEKRNERLMKELNGKMGISFHDVIVLFISSDPSDKEIQALFTHEYNHICRLAHLQKEFHELTLLDSMIIEGMAEVAVEKTLGKNVLAPWVSLYSKEEVIQYWNKIYQFLHVKGKKNHDPILYGDQNRGYPKWLGYSLGYYIVNSFIKKNKGMTIKDLLKVDSNKILAESDFAIK